MTIRQFLNGYSFDPEAVRSIGIAFEMTRAAVQLAGRTDLTDEADRQLGRVPARA